jgi:hypothetical protein
MLIKIIHRKVHNKDKCTQLHHNNTSFTKTFIKIRTLMLKKV